MIVKILCGRADTAVPVTLTPTADRAFSVDLAGAESGIATISGRQDQDRVMVHLSRYEVANLAQMMQITKADMEEAAKICNNTG